MHATMSTRLGSYMPPCPNCLATTAREGSPSPHAAMQITSTQRLKLPKEGIVTVSTFRCGICGTNWQYVEGKRTSSPGWYLLQDAPHEGTAT